jgi:hypothetical protein
MVIAFNTVVHECLLAMPEDFCVKPGIFLFSDNPYLEVNFDAYHLVIPKAFYLEKLFSGVGFQLQRIVSELALLAVICEIYLRYPRE